MTRTVTLLQPNSNISRYFTKIISQKEIYYFPHLFLYLVPSFLILIDNFKEQMVWEYFLVKIK